MSNFGITVLGTASAVPIADRNPSAQVLNVHGRLFLIDCGEGTQQQFRRFHQSFLKVEAIFISHIHGDHCLGIFGLLSTMAMYGRTAPLSIFAPRSFGPVLKFYMSYFWEDLSYQVEHVALDAKEPKEIYRSGELVVSAFPLNHKIECFGFRFCY
ncbi:MAG: MBL fold metallo-hydrolase [Bacteroidales bacterium]|nr:MBL fold metallo-hydrolase [Bacteroidales bacterium]